MVRSDARVVRAANAVPIWHAARPAKVIVVAARYSSCGGEPSPVAPPWVPAGPVQYPEEAAGRGERLAAGLLGAGIDPLAFLGGGDDRYRADGARGEMA